MGKKKKKAIYLLAAFNKSIFLWYQTSVITMDAFLFKSSKVDVANW